MLLGNQAPYLTGVQACFQPGAMIYDLVDQRHETNKKKRRNCMLPSPHCGVESPLDVLPDEPLVFTWRDQHTTSLCLAMERRIAVHHHERNHSLNGVRIAAVPNLRGDVIPTSK